MPAAITRITATIAATQPSAWPHFAGSALRGAFGRALRQAACVTGQQQCGGCPLRNTCAYGVVFDPAPPPQPLHPSFRDGLPRYLVQPPELKACSLRTGQRQSFALLLFPGSQPHHKLIEHLLKAAVEQQLFAPGLFKLHQTQTDTLALPSGLPPAPAWSPPSESQSASPEPITLRWLTPLRLQAKGKPIFKPQALDATTLVRALLRRQLQWCQWTNQQPAEHTATLAAASACQLDTRQLQWHEIQRHSSTQRQTLPLGGLIGSATLLGPAPALQTLWPLLQLGEQLHIGKETVMGLGRYQLSQATVAQPPQAA